MTSIIQTCWTDLNLKSLKEPADEMSRIYNLELISIYFLSFHKNFWILSKNAIERSF